MSKVRTLVELWGCVGICLILFGLIVLGPLIATLVYRAKLETVNAKIARVDAQYTLGSCNILACSFTDYQPDNSVWVELLLQPVTQPQVKQTYLQGMPLDRAVNLCHYINQTGCYYNVVNASKYCSLNRWVSPTNYSEENGYNLALLFLCIFSVIPGMVTFVILLLSIGRSIKLAFQKERPYEMVV